MSYPKDDWLVIEGFEGYFATPDGEIWSMNARSVKGCSRLQGGPYRIKKSIDKRTKKHRVTLRRGGNRYKKQVDHIVCGNFVSPRNPKTACVIHKNGDVLDDSAGNLVWMERPAAMSHVARSQTSHKEGAVYIFWLDGTYYYKIGFSTDVPKRLSAISASIPFDLTLFGWAYGPNASAVEKRLHRELEGKRVKGEWFCLDPGAAAEIKESISFDVL